MNLSLTPDAWREGPRFHRGRAPMVLITFAIGVLIAGACTADDPLDIADRSSVGLVAFREAGCASCHGQDGEGGVGPAMGGHQAEQVIRQVRAPLGAMPLFNTAQLSDENLDAIVEFVVGLEPVDHGAAHGHDDDGTLDPRDVLVGHHWMTLSAIQADSTAEAIHHIGHIAELVTGGHLVSMNEVVDFLEARDLDAAEAQTMEMLAGFVPEAGAIDELHLRLALQALAVDEITEAVDHLERVGDGASADAAQEALHALDAGDATEATGLLLDALGHAGHDNGDDHDDG